MSKRAWLVVAVVVVLGAAILVPVAIAATATTTVSGTAITAIKMVRSDNLEAYLAQGGSPSDTRPWVYVPGASTTMTIPARTKAAFLITFSEQHRCTGSGPGPDAGGGFGCRLRVLVNGVAASPAQFTVSAGDVGGTDTIQFEDAVTTQFSTSVLPAGSYTLQMQYSTAAGANTMGVQMLIREAHLTVTRVKA